MRALVIAHGEPPSDDLFRSLAADAALCVAADGGVEHALRLGIPVDAVVGDLDSVSLEARAALPPAALHKVFNPDTTDLQKAIEFCIARGANEVLVAAVGGGRADHALANLSVLMVFRGLADLRVVDDDFEVSLIEHTAVIDAPPGTVVSLVAIGQAQGVTTTGLRWDLTDYPLAFSPYGIHNEVRVPPATVSVTSGDVLLFRGRWVEKHA